MTMTTTGHLRVTTHSRFNSIRNQKQQTLLNSSFSRSRLPWILHSVTSQSTGNMIFYFAWIFLICPLVTAYPASEDETTPTPLENAMNPPSSHKRQTLQDLLQVFEMLDLGSRNREAVGSMKPGSCVIPKHLLVSLTESLREIHTYVPKPEDDGQAVKEPISTGFVESATSCDRAKFQLGANMDHLSKIYLNLLFNSTKMDEDEIKRVQKLYHGIRDSLDSDMEALKAKVDDETKINLEKVLMEKNKLQLRIEAIISDSEFNVSLETKYKENLMELIASQIDEGHVNSAKEKFAMLNDLLAVINLKPNNDYLVKFISELPTLHEQLNGFQLLLDQDRLGYSIFTLQYYFDKITDHKENPKEVQVHASIKKNIKIKSNKMVEEIVETVATKPAKKYADLIRYTRSEQPAFNAHLEDIVERVYNFNVRGVDVIDKLLTFSDELTIIAQSARLYVKLYKLMEDSYDLTFKPVFEIAFKLKQLTKMKNHVNTPSQVLKAMNHLQETMPESVKSLIWGKFCLKNEQANGYLYKKGPFDSNRNNVIVSPSDRDYWELELKSDSNAFSIRHSETQEYLYAEEDEFAFNPTKRWVFTWRNVSGQDHNQHWRLTDIDWKNGQFRIQNDETEEHLNADADPDSEPEKGTGNDQLATQLEEIPSKKNPLATAIHRLVESYKKIDRNQAFTWRGRSSGKNHGWLVIDSNKCK